MLAIAHTVLDPLRRGDARAARRARHAARRHVARRDARRATGAPRVADALRRFVTTPDATQAIVARPGGVPAGRFRPPVYVTIWTAVET